MGHAPDKFFSELLLFKINVLCYSCNCVRKKKIISASEEATKASGFIFLMIYCLILKNNPYLIPYIKINSKSGSMM